MQLLLDKGTENKIIEVLTNSPIVIKAIASHEIKSKLVLSCRTILNKLSIRNRLNLICSPNCKDRVVKEKLMVVYSRYNSEKILVNANIPINSIYITVDKKIKALAENNWKNTTSFKCTKMFFPCYLK